MGFNHAAAFIDAPADAYIKPFKPWFEGPVVGFNKVANTGLLDLRARWLDAFLSAVKGFNPEIPRDVATEWANVHFPKTADDLAMSMTLGEPQKLAFRLADAWDAA